jgi:hypothetical protein
VVDVSHHHIGEFRASSVHDRTEVDTDGSPCSLSAGLAPIGGGSRISSGRLSRALFRAGYEPRGDEPKCTSMDQGLDPLGAPPACLIVNGMKFIEMQNTERHGVFVAHLDRSGER